VAHDVGAEFATVEARMKRGRESQSFRREGCRRANTTTGGGIKGTFAIARSRHMLLIDALGRLRDHDLAFPDTGSIAEDPMGISITSAFELAL
jgi:hypothetical protein